MNLKSSILENKKYILIYLILVIGLTFLMLGPKNYQYWGFEVVSIPVITVIGLGLIMYSYDREIELHKTALLFIIVFGLLMVFLGPPMTFLDESAHFTRAELLSEGAIIPEKNEMGFEVNNYFFGLNQPQKGLTVFDNPAINNPINDSRGNWSFTTETPFYSYIPSAIGILIAKFLDMTAIYALLFARVCNLLIYAGVAYYTIKKVPAFKIGLTVIATMPLVITQAASTSYDAFIFTFTLIILYYFVKMYNEKSTDRDISIFYIAVLLISLIKPPFCILSLLTVIIPGENFVRSKNYYIMGILLVFLATIFLNGTVLNMLFPSLHVASANSIFPSNISPSGQVNYILTHPLILFDLMKHIIINIPGVFVTELTIFHYADFKGLKFYNLAYALFFILFSVFYKKDIILLKNQRIILLVMLVLSYLGIYGIFYLTYTPVGAGEILGVQARYFIPFIALLPLIISYDEKSREEYKYLMMFIVLFLSGLVLLTITHYY